MELYPALYIFMCHDNTFFWFQIVCGQLGAMQTEHAVTFPLQEEEKFSRTVALAMVMVVFHGAIQHQTMQVYRSGETVC